MAGRSPRSASLPRRAPRSGASGAKFSRAPFERMMRLQAMIAHERFPNCRTMAERLEVSSKTVQRDIDFLRDRFGLPIAYDDAEFGYYFTKPVTHFPALEISEGEVAALFIAQKALAEQRATAFEKPLR